MLGDGIIDLRGIRVAVDAAGYDGPIEVEVINPALRAFAGDELLALVCAALRRVRGLATYAGAVVRRGVSRCGSSISAWAPLAAASPRIVRAATAPSS